ncbi:hypothetical protein [uncultured Psychrobacter sp.]|uniref:hypothetical protein n=1 Tax=uncultured Psychrobacter sp. TaxID=259303 RepID=UPI0030DCE644
MSNYSEPLNEAQKKEYLDVLSVELDAYRKDQITKLLAITDNQNSRKADIGSGIIDVTSPEYIKMVENEQAAYAEHMELARDADMRPERFALHNGKLLDPSLAERETNNRLKNQEDGLFSELFDFEQVGLIGLLSEQTKNEVNANNPYEIKDGIAYKEKGSDITTNMYVVQDESNRLWMMADQRDAQNNIISQNQDSYRAIGINPNKFMQNVAVQPGEPTSDMQAMYEQISPNSIRMAINKDQMLPLESRVSYAAAIEAQERAEVAAQIQRREALGAENIQATDTNPILLTEGVTLTPLKSLEQRLNDRIDATGLEMTAARLALAAAGGPSPEVVKKMAESGDSITKMMPLFDNDIKISSNEPAPSIDIDNPYEDKYGQAKAGSIIITDAQIQRFNEMEEQDRLAAEARAKDAALHGPAHVIKQQEVSQIASPDIKSRLVAHKSFNEALELFKHKDRTLHKYRLQSLEENKLSNIKARESNPNKTNLAALDSFNPIRDKAAYLHRLSLMRSVLKPSEMMMHDGAMMSSKDAQKMINGQYNELDNGQFMALNDIEGSMLAGKPSDDTNERLTKELGGKDEQLVKAITLRDKGSDTETNIYVVESATGELWVRADQTDSKGNIISRNDDSFAAVGLAGASFKQGIPSDDYRFSDGKEVLLGQLDANSMRVMVSEQQMNNFAQKTASTDYEINTGLTPRKPANEEEAFVDAMYDIKPLNAEQSKNIGEWARYQSGGMFGVGSDTNPNIPKGAVFNDAYEITNKIGGGSVIVANMTVTDTEFPYHQTQQNIVTSIDKNGEPTNHVSWQADFALDRNTKVTADDIRKTLDESKKGAYSSRNISAPKLDGTYGASATNSKTPTETAPPAPQNNPIRNTRP